MEDLKELLERYKKYFMLGAVLLVLFLVAGGALSYFLRPAPKDDFLQPKTIYSSSFTHSFTSKTNKKATASYVYVDIKGAVKEPGLYKISATKRVR